MSTTTTPSIALEPEFLKLLQAYTAITDEAAAGPASEALNDYLEQRTDPEWVELLRRTRAHGKAMGITSEADVERLCDEYRQERRRA